MNGATLTLEEALARALAHHHQGETAVAEQWYRAILQAVPQHPQANHNLGVIAMQAGHPDVGLSHFKAALDADPGEETYWLSYVQTLLAGGHGATARDALEAARVRGMSSPEWEALATDVTNLAGNHPSMDEMTRLADWFNDGRHVELEPFAEALAQRYPASGVVWKVLGATRLALGKDGVPALRRATELLPDDGELWHVLGGALYAAGLPDEARVCFANVLRISPANAEAHNDLGNALRAAGQTAAAGEHYRAALKLRPAFPEALCNLAAWELAESRPAATLENCRRALELRPGFGEAHFHLAMAHKALGETGAALAEYRNALAARPNYPEACCNLGNLLRESGDATEAEKYCRRAIELAPRMAEAHANLGNTLKDQRRYLEARDAYQRALELRPPYPEALLNLANTLQELDRLGDAAVLYRRLIEADPGNAAAHFNLSQCLLASAHFPEGWQEYEYRWEGAQPRRPRPATDLPQWRGEAVEADARLLVFEEQGIGDRIQFARYLPLVAHRFAGGVSVVGSDALRSLFQRAFPEIEFLPALPPGRNDWQWHCPLLSLPLALGTRGDDIPANTPYLNADLQRIAEWKGRIEALGLPARTRRFGLVWKSGKAQQGGEARNLSLAALAPLLDLPDTVWFSLQKESDPHAARWTDTGKLYEWAGDFEETAALAMNLDGVVTVDTSLAHLAGALALPTFLLLRFAAEWRWQRERTDSPWYPQMRLFRQAVAGEWSDAVSRIAAELALVGRR